MSKDAIKTLLSNAEKKYGKGSLKFGDEIARVPIICPTGSLKMDMAIGCGGIPQSRIIEYFGPPSGGKTTLSIITMAQCQKTYKDKTVAFIDLENSFDRDWATNLGLDCDNMLFAQPNSGEETFTLIDMMIESGEVSFIVVDSVGGIQTQAQLDADYDQAQMAQLARFLSQALPKQVMKLKNKLTSILYINQIRMKIGSYGNPEDTQGGLALKHAASVRAEVRRGEVIGLKEEPEGFVTKIKLLKNKVGPPFRKIETELYVGPKKFGIDTFSEVVDLAITNEIVNKAGAWFKYEINGVEERFQGKNNFVEFVKNNKEVYEEIWNKVSKTVLKKDAPIIGSFDNLQDKIEEEKETKKNRRKSKKDESEAEEINIESETNENEK